MRRALFILVSLLLVGALASWQLQKGQGYILIAVGPYTIETSLWFGLLLLVLIWVLWTLAKALLARLFGPRQGLLPVWRHARERRCRRRRDEGFHELLYGRWGSARALLERSGKNSDKPLLSWLAAATAALEQGDIDGAQRLVANAAGQDPESLGVQLLEARLLLRQQRHGEALVILERLHGREPSHQEVLRLLVDTHYILGHWQPLEKLLPEIKRHKALPPHQQHKICLAVYGALLQQAALPDGVSSVTAARERTLGIWERIPAIYRRDSRLLAVLVRQLHNIGEDQLAESQLRNALKREWNTELVGLYGMIKHRDLAESLSVAEKWLGMHPNEPVLLLALGRLSRRGQLWGKARDYFEAALRQDPTPEVYAELAALAASLGDTTASAEYYRLGMAQSGTSAVGSGQPGV